MSNFLLPADVKRLPAAEQWQVKAIMRSDVGMDGRFSLLVMGCCILMCASCSDNVPTTAEDAGVLQVHKLFTVLCCNV